MQHIKREKILKYIKYDRSRFWSFCSKILKFTKNKRKNFEFFRIFLKRAVWIVLLSKQNLTIINFDEFLAKQIVKLKN